MNNKYKIAEELHKFFRRGLNSEVKRGEESIIRLVDVFHFSTSDVLFTLNVLFRHALKIEDKNKLKFSEKLEYDKSMIDQFHKILDAITKMAKMQYRNELSDLHLNKDVVVILLSDILEAIEHSKSFIVDEGKSTPYLISLL